MVKIINNYQEYIKELKKSKGHNLYLSTYGLTVDLDLKEIFKNAKQLKVLVGLYDRYCYRGCEHCERNIRLNKSNILKYQKEFPGIKAVNFLHKKIAIFNNKVIIGGFNLTGSMFVDNAILITNKKLVKESITLFEKQYSNIEEEVLFDFKTIIIKFGKYKNQTKETLLKDKSYLEYMKNTVSKEQYYNLINGKKPITKQ